MGLYAVNPTKVSEYAQKYHNHKFQTNPRHREEESQNTNNHKTSGRQFKRRKKLSLFLVKMIEKLERTLSNA